MALGRRPFQLRQGGSSAVCHEPRRLQPDAVEKRTGRHGSPVYAGRAWCLTGQQRSADGIEALPAEWQRAGSLVLSDEADSYRSQEPACRQFLCRSKLVKLRSMRLAACFPSTPKSFTAARGLATVAVRRNTRQERYQDRQSLPDRQIRCVPSGQWSMDLTQADSRRDGGLALLFRF